MNPYLVFLCEPQRNKPPFICMLLSPFVQLHQQLLWRVTNQSQSSWIAYSLFPETAVDFIDENNEKEKEF